MKILCIGDSLALPREECQYEDTWFYKLKKDFPQHEFIDYFTRGLLIKNAVFDFDTYYQFYKADVVIIQTGICDCSPRYINNIKRPYKQIQGICTLLKLDGLFWKLVKKRTRKPDCVYTSINSFETLYNQLVKSFLEAGAKKIIVVRIGHSAESVAVRNPYMNQNVDKYNLVLEKIHDRLKEKTILISPLEQVDESFFVDGYHCNAKGMYVVYDKLKGVLSEINE